MPWNFRCLGISCCLNWLAEELVCFHILYNICVTFMQEAIHKKYKLLKTESEEKTWRQVSTTLWRSFAIKGRSEMGWWLGLGGWGKFSCFICKELSSERWSVSLRLTQLAWVSGEWLPAPGPQHSAPTIPTAAASFCGHYEGPWILGLRVVPLLLWEFQDPEPWSWRDQRCLLTWLVFSLTCLLLWHETSSRHVPGSSLWSRADHPPTRLPLRCEPKTSFAEFTVEAGSEIPSRRVFLVLPESQNVVMRPLALRLSKESPKWPLNSSGNWRLVQWAGAFVLCCDPSCPWHDGASSALAQSIHQEKGTVFPFVCLVFSCKRMESDGAISKSLPATEILDVLYDVIWTYKVSS